MIQINCIHLGVKALPKIIMETMTNLLTKLHRCWLNSTARGGVSTTLSIHQ